MSVRTLLVVLLAIGCGGVATYGMFSIVASTRGSADATPIVETEQVAVLTIDVGLVGTTITSDMVKLQDWPKDYLPDGYITDLEEVIDETLRVPVRAGELLLRGKFGAGRGMAAIVDPGYRAFTIHTPNHSAGVAGFVMPGDTVDVLLTREDPEIPGGSVTTALLQNVKVLASDQNINAPEANTIKTLKSVTLSVTPDEGKILTLAQSGGTLTLMLRNKEDLQTAKDGAITWKDIEGSEAYAEEQMNQVLTSVIKESDSATTAISKLAEDSVEVQEKTKQPLTIRTLRGLSIGEIQAHRSQPF
jgi:pilus assembly protein CpaB